MLTGANSLPAGTPGGGDPVKLRRTLGAFFLVMFSIQLFFSNHYLDGDMANSIIGLSAAIVEERGLSVDAFSRSDASSDVALYGGRYYSGLAPGLSIIAIPVYVGVKAFLAYLPASLEPRLDQLIRGAVSPGPTRTSVRHTPHPARFALVHVFLNVLVSATTLYMAWLLFRIGTQWPEASPNAVWLPLALLFATPYFYWGNYVAPQPVSTALILWAFYIVEFARCPPSVRVRALLAGFAMSLAAATSYAAVLGVGTLGFFYLARRRWTTVTWMIVGGLLPAALLAVYQQAAFGSPFVTAYSYRLFSRGSVLINFTLPTIPRLTRLAVGLREGLLTTTPILLVALFGLRRVARDPARRPYVVLSLAMATVNIAYCAVRTDSSTAGFGARYFLPALPFLLLGITGVTRGRPESASRWGIPLLCALSVAVNLVGAFYGSLINEASPLALITRFGLSSYTLRTLSSYGLLPSAFVSTAVVLTALVMAAWCLFVCGKRLHRLSAHTPLV